MKGLFFTTHEGDFEYRNESVKDREVVHAILAKLTKEVSSDD